MGAPLCGYMVDALFPDEKVIVELDSWPFHKGRIAFETDRERDADTLAKGFVTIRVTEDRLNDQPNEEANRLHAILEQRRHADHAPKAA
jgi:very-short-patch-repair endonuclease